MNKIEQKIEQLEVKKSDCNATIVLMGLVGVVLMIIMLSLKPGLWAIAFIAGSAGSFIAAARAMMKKAAIQEEIEQMQDSLPPVMVDVNEVIAREMINDQRREELMSPSYAFHARNISNTSTLSLSLLNLWDSWDHEKVEQYESQAKTGSLEPSRHYDDNNH